MTHSLQFKSWNLHHLYVQGLSLVLRMCSSSRSRMRFTGQTVERGKGEQETQVKGRVSGRQEKEKYRYKVGGGR